MLNRITRRVAGEAEFSWAIKQLEAAGLVRHTGDGDVQLTEVGVNAAIALENKYTEEERIMMLLYYYALWEVGIDEQSH